MPLTVSHTCKKHGNHNAQFDKFSFYHKMLWTTIRDAILISISPHWIVQTLIDTIWRENAIRNKIAEIWFHLFYQTLSFLSIIFFLALLTLYQILLSICHTMQLFTFHFEIHQQNVLARIFFSFKKTFKIKVDEKSHEIHSEYIQFDRINSL